MKHILSTTAIAAALAFGGYGLVGAQVVNPSQPGSAGGGVQAQSGQPGQMGQPGQTGRSGSTAPGMTGGSSAQSGTQSPTMPGGSGMSSGSTTGQTGSTGGAQQASRMSEDAVGAALRARGYSDIKGLERDGDTFRVKEAKRYGEDVENLRIDARTGQVRDEKRLSEDQARNLLRDQGYSDVSDVSRDGNTITAKAKRNDREVRLRIDANTGVVSQQQASN